MGNWRTVNITGTMSSADAAKLYDLLDRGPEFDWGHWGEPYACLSFSSTRPGLSGLGAWPNTTVNRAGNLAERDYSVEDVHEALEFLVHAAPSMLLKVHCGGEHESEECVATISVGEGLVVTGKPEQAAVSGPSQEQMFRHLAINLMR